MSSLAPEISGNVGKRQRWYARVLAREMWASLAISVMWLAVLFDAVFGPNFVSSSASGATTTIPSAIFVALFAYLGTRIVARYGFGRPTDVEPKR